MNRLLFAMITLGELVLIGGFMILYPRIARRGLLFGVYVGEEMSDGDQARAIVREWTGRGILWMLLCALGGMAAYSMAPVPAVAAVVPVAALAGFLILYLRAYVKARRLAAPGPPPPDAALTLPAESFPVAPWVALAVGLLGGMVSVWYAGSHYLELPARVPTHFGASGAPDAWRARSFPTVMLLPLMALVMGAGMPIIALLTARAKRSIRYPAAGASAEAQARFRRAMARFLSGTAILVTGLLTYLSIGAIRVGLGQARTLGPLTWVWTGALLVWALSGSLYLALFYGQGGARLEGRHTSAPLTDGLADNRHWVLGAFYVNRDDPSIMVEHRFGLGYTVNFGNPKAVALVILFLGLLLGLAAWALITN